MTMKLTCLLPNNKQRTEMKKLLTIIIWLTAAACTASAENWCEELIRFLSEQKNVDRNVAVSRDPESHEITSATYDFHFTSENLYKTIADNIRCHETEADYYTENVKKHKTILARFTCKGQRWSCKLQPLDNKGKQFLVTVKSGDSANELRYPNVEDLQRALNEYDVNYEDRMKDFEKQMKEYEEKMKSFEKKKEEFIRKNRPTTTQGGGASSGTKNVIVNDPPTKAKAQEIKAHNDELKRAEEERRRKLASE